MAETGYQTGGGYSVSINATESWQLMVYLILNVNNDMS